MDQYWIDTHAHLYSKEFEADRLDMIQRCFDAGVRKLFMPNVDHNSVEGMLELEANYPEHCFAMMGLHPCSVDKDFQRELYQVEQWLSKRKFIAVGEIGTDLYWDKTFWGQQKEAFEIQLALALKYSLPVVIHCRESIDETIGLVEKYVDKNPRGVFHCFTGSALQAKKITELGFYLGIGGVSTFKKGGLDAVLPEVSMERIVLETDSPYLAPVPHRGKRNEPSYIPLVAQRVAEIKKISIDEVRSMTTKNALELFQMTE
jgi:TatD DNase family protein